MVTVWQKKKRTILDFMEDFPLDCSDIERVCTTAELEKALDEIKGTVFFNTFYDLHHHNFERFDRYEDRFKQLVVVRATVPKYDSYGTSSSLHVIYRPDSPIREGIVFRKHSRNENWLVLPPDLAAENIERAKKYLIAQESI